MDKKKDEDKEQIANIMCKHCKRANKINISVRIKAISCQYCYKRLDIPVSTQQRVPSCESEK
jgi:hypothetical protein